MDLINSQELPEEIIIDFDSGYSINIPLGEQVATPLAISEAVYNRIIELRKKFGVVGIIDFPDEARL